MKNVTICPECGEYGKVALGGGWLHPSKLYRKYYGDDQLYPYGSE